MAGIHAAALAAGDAPRAAAARRPPSARSATTSPAPTRSNYQPANITFDLLPQLDDADRQRLRHDKKARHADRLPARPRSARRVPPCPMSELGAPDRPLPRGTRARRQLRALHPRLRGRPARSSSTTSRRPISPRPRPPPRPARSSANGSPASTATNSAPSPSAANWPPSAGSSASCCAKASSPLNVARLVRTPKAPKKLPEVMTAEQANTLIDGVGGDHLERPFPARDRAIFELLYGCGMRVSELAGLNLEDIDRSEGWLRVRGKGKKERQVPLPGQAAAGPGTLPRRTPRGARRRPPSSSTTAAPASPTRGISGIVKLYATLPRRRPVHPSAQLPPRLRHPPARRWRRPARHPGTARPRPPLHHAEVHPGIADRPDGGLRQGAP